MLCESKIYDSIENDCNCVWYYKIIGKKLNKFLDPESKRLVSNDLIKNYREKESPLLCELNIVRKSGEKRRVEINVSRIEDSSGNIKIIGLMLDITKRKKA